MDLAEKFFNFLKKADLVDFYLIEDKPFPKKVKIDIAFVEGNPITEENVEMLKKIREESKILVALGNCAALGGIPEIKNYKGKEKTIRYIYKNSKGIANPDIKEIDNFVKVDFVIPGCPINGEEFLKLAEELIKGKIPEISQNPVCAECPLRGTPKCYLPRKEICFGLISLAGCGAICPKNGDFCRACRGLLKKANVKGLFNILEKSHDRKKIEEELEVFGVKDDVDDMLNNKNK